MPPRHTKMLDTVRSIVSRTHQIGVSKSIRIGLARLPVTPYLYERHCWSVIDLHASRPRFPVPDGFTLRRADVHDVHRLEELDASFDRSADWIEAGHQLWLLTDAQRVVFSVWCFIGSAPNVASPHGWMALPPRTANVDDAVAAPDLRGQGLAPAVYSSVFDAIERDDGIARVLGVIHEGNTANRRAAYKVGWREFGIVDMRKLGFVRQERDWRNRSGGMGRFSWNRVRVEQSANGDEISLRLADELVDYLGAALLPPGVTGPPRTPAGEIDATPR